MKCKNCGTENAPMTAFCGVCGAPLEGNEFQQVPVNTSAENPIDPPKKKKKGLKIAIIIISIALVLTLCLIIGLVLIVHYTFSTLSNAYFFEDLFEPKNKIESYIDNVYPETELFVDAYEDGYNYDESNTEEYVNGNYSSITNLADFCGMFYDGDNVNGPCYAVDLLSFNETNNIAVIEVSYVGVNASPYYSTGEITLTLDEEGFAEFDWEDTWYNSGHGSVKFVTDGDTPYVEVNMTQTVTSDFNRASLATANTRILYYGE